MTIQVPDGKGLKACGTASCVLYIRQSHMHDGKAIGAALRAWFGDHPPRSTWIGVPSLADEDFLIEIEPSPVYLTAARS